MKTFSEFLQIREGATIGANVGNPVANQLKDKKISDALIRNTTDPKKKQVVTNAVNIKNTDRTMDMDTAIDVARLKDKI